MGAPLRVVPLTQTFTLHKDLKAADLTFNICEKALAVELCRAWHSRLPNTQKGPWQFAFAAVAPDGEVVAVALWNNPSARTLPNHWLELRRMACAPSAPKNTASRFLAWMARYFAKEHAHREKLISYQDTAVHVGTMYKAAGWAVDFVSKARIRDRSKNRAGTNRKYRSDMNGLAPAASEKIRWAKTLPPPRKKPLLQDLI